MTLGPPHHAAPATTLLRLACNAAPTPTAMPTATPPHLLHVEQPVRGPIAMVAGLLVEGDQPRRRQRPSEHVRAPPGPVDRHGCRCRCRGAAAAAATDVVEARTAAARAAVREAVHDVSLHFCEVRVRAGRRAGSTGGGRRLPGLQRQLRRLLDAHAARGGAARKGCGRARRQLLLQVEDLALCLNSKCTQQWTGARREPQHVFCARSASRHRRDRRRAARPTSLPDADCRRFAVQSNAVQCRAALATHLGCWPAGRSPRRPGSLPRARRRCRWTGGRSAAGCGGAAARRGRRPCPAARGQ